MLRSFLIWLNYDSRGLQILFSRPRQHLVAFKSYF